MAIIDILTHYDAKKKAAHAAKTVKHGVSVKISALLATDCLSCCSAVCRCKHDETKAAQAWPRALKAFLSNHHLLPDDVNHMARLIAAACSLMSLSFKDCFYNYYRFVWHSHRGNRFCVWFSLKGLFFLLLKCVLLCTLSHVSLHLNRVYVYFLVPRRGPRSRQWTRSSTPNDSTSSCPTSYRKHHLPVQPAGLSLSQICQMPRPRTHARTRFSPPSPQCRSVSHR